MKLTDIARVVRSKNAGPTTLSFDLMFNDEVGFRRACNAPSLTREALAELYGQQPERVHVIHYAPALAIKVAMDRRVTAGDPGDSDVYGAQQHGALLEVEL